MRVGGASGSIEPLDVGFLTLDEQFALRAGAAHRFDLVFCGVAEQADQQLGEITGIALAEDLRRPTGGCRPRG